MKDLSKKRTMMRAPRRGWSMTDYQVHGDHSQTAASATHINRHAPIPENAPLSVPAEPRDVAGSQKEKISRMPLRPKLPPPRRSYSVTDCEPVPPDQPKPPKDYTLLDLPSELHYVIFDQLDPIDSVCLGLTNSNLYQIHRRLHGTVALSSRYSGPNDMEWAWRGAGPLVHRQPHAAEAKENSIEQMRVRGQVYCRKCGISRCELHRHLRDWVGEGYEYCSIKETYGPPAPEGSKQYCYMKSPKNPHRCGRHGGKKNLATQ